MPDAPLTVARRYTAAGAQAWPAQTLHYDGAWAIRISRDCSARRQNSVTPLDPSDASDIEARVASAARRFQPVDRRPRFLVSPLCAQEIVEHLAAAGWTEEAPTAIVRRDVDLEAEPTGIELDRLKADAFVAAAAAMGSATVARGDELAAVLARIEPPSFHFVLRGDDGEPTAGVICVRQGDMIGCFELLVAEGRRGEGHGKRLLSGVIDWAARRKASSVWMQVQRDNAGSQALARALGFEAVHDYFYMLAPETTP